MKTQFPLNKFLSIPTPFYYYDTALLHETIKRLKAALPNPKSATPNPRVIHYALKANTNDRILHIIREHGLGADCVSGNEIKKAIDSGFAPDEIVFAGVGKTDNEIILALEKDIFCFNCESPEEIKVINALAAGMNRTAKIALRINPNVDANTHHYITTGLEENKFGINTWELNDVLHLLRNCPNIELIGLHFHIGSQITDLDVFKTLCVRINELQQWFIDRNVLPLHINVGGGLGVDYHEPDKNPVPDFKEYFSVFSRFLELKPGQQLHFELGRAIVAQCASLISKVLYIKKGININFIILDAGMTELIRPALYNSYHKIEKIGTGDGGQETRYDVVGPICESSDCFGKAVMFPETFRGDLIAIRSTGAYGEAMSSNYNLREKVAAVYSIDELSEK